MTGSVEYFVLSPAERRLRELGIPISVLPAVALGLDDDPRIKGVILIQLPDVAMVATRTGLASLERLRFAEIVEGILMPILAGQTPERAGWEELPAGYRRIIAFDPDPFDPPPDAYRDHIVVHWRQIAAGQRERLNEAAAADAVRKSGPTDPLTVPGAPLLLPNEHVQPVVGGELFYVDASGNSFSSNGVNLTVELRVGWFTDGQTVYPNFISETLVSSISTTTTTSGFWLSNTATAPATARYARVAIRANQNAGASSMLVTVGQVEAHR